MKKSEARWLLLGAAAGAAVGVTVALLQQSRVRRLALAREVDRLTRRTVQRLPVAAESRWIHVGNLQLHAVLAGPVDGPLVVLLHGFPECWYSWRHQIPALAHAGYRVVVPDQRGYNLSDKPPGVPCYGLDYLTTDVKRVIQSQGRDRAVVVAHDWGGATAWRFAMETPDMVKKLVVMNAPHPVALARELRRSWEQRLKSWYILAFQIPWLPENLLSLWPQATARLFFRRTAVRPDAFADADLEVMATALAQPGAMTAMIDWYRAALRHPPAGRARAIHAPTLLIWAEDDVALSKSLTYGLEKWVPDLDVHYIPRCGHWVQNEAPEEVNERLLAFLGPAK